MFKVILVDDNSTFLDGFYKLIKWSDYDMEIVGKFDDGKQALEYIKKHPLDAVITDISMPELSGVELASFLYEKYPHIKIVFFSAFCTFEYAEKAINYNVVSYIRKPIAPKRMNEALCKLRDMLREKSANDTEKNVMPAPKAEKESDIILKVEEYVEEHYQEAITLEAMAGICHFDTRHFSRMFLKAKGEKFLDYLNKVRIRKAQDMLLEGYDTAEVYSKVGYGSRRYFFKQFSHYTGVTPAQYRKKMMEARK